ncbi:MAG: NAD(P)/FAD-dependent oxidoreductase [Labilithrix sp.]|nr:NAD(P)/FAD-dependent oxidoreductase [Labilithrix sp.]
MTTRPHVVIIGAGFGGLSAAQALARAPADVTVVDRENHHLFQPLLYQVATAGLSAADIASPIRSILRRQKNTSVLLAEACAVDLANKRVVVDCGALAYDFLVLAAGATARYFDHPEWREWAPPMKSLDDAIEVRRRVLLAFESAERELDPARRRELLQFTVIGGGPTGVELAGAIAELARALARDFRHADPRTAQIHLLEAGPRILSMFDDDLAARGLEQLHELGVNVFTHAVVVEVDAHGVTLEGGGHIASATTIWTAGVEPAPITRTLGVTLEGGRVPVEHDLSIVGHPDAFAIGDVASFKPRVEDGAASKPLPGLAPVAIQEGRAVGKAILATIRGKPRAPFRYVDKGIMATIGRSRAIAQLERLHLSGFVAWLAWLVVHIVMLIGFRNRVVVLFTWAWSYLTYRRGARLITGLDHAPSGVPARPYTCEDALARA